jgi:hypothetical protein
MVHEDEAPSAVSAAVETGMADPTVGYELDHCAIACELGPSS